MIEQFNEFLMKLLKQMANGNFIVYLICADEKKFPARVLLILRPIDTLILLVRIFVNKTTQNVRK